jgi:hypothetical protein
MAYILAVVVLFVVAVVGDDHFPFGMLQLNAHKIDGGHTTLV